MRWPMVHLPGDFSHTLPLFCRTSPACLNEQHSCRSTFRRVSRASISWSLLAKKRASSWRQVSRVTRGQPTEACLLCRVVQPMISLRMAVTAWYQAESALASISAALLLQATTLGVLLECTSQVQVQPNASTLQQRADCLHM